VNRLTALLCLLAIIAAPRIAAAQDDPDYQAWGQLLVLGSLGDGWRTHIELQPRFMQDASELGLTIVRTAIGHTAGRRTTVWAGYAWVPRALGDGVRHEQRAWQQVQATPPPVAGWAPTLRVRFEQRWLSPWAGTSHRARFLGRLQRSLDADRRWSVYTYDEAMLTIDTTARGPSRGFDRNRLSSGVSRRLSPRASTDVGYLWEHAVAAVGHRNDHVLIAVINLSAPR